MIIFEIHIAIIMYSWNAENAFKDWRAKTCRCSSLVPRRMVRRRTGVSWLSFQAGSCQGWNLEGHQTDPDRGVGRLLISISKSPSAHDFHLPTVKGNWKETKRKFYYSIFRHYSGGGGSRIFGRGHYHFELTGGKNINKKVNTCCRGGGTIYKRIKTI